MKIINYLSVLAMPMIILIIVVYGIKEKINIFDIFIQGAEEGIKIVVKLFPTLLGLFVSISMLRNSGIIDMIINVIKPIISLLNIPSEILPLALLRPISGSSSIAIATDIMSKYGVDSKIGLIACVIMGSTETTIYTIAVYTSCINIKNSKQVLCIALIGDLIGMITSVVMCNLIF